MYRAVRVVVVAAIGLTFAACNLNNGGEASLTITPNPRTAAPGQKVTLTLSATDSQNKNGTGQVSLTTTAGTLTDTNVTLADGSATTTFVCDATDLECSGTVTISGSWTPAKATAAVTADAKVTIKTPSDGGADGGGGRDGGSDDGGTGIGDGGVKIVLTTSKTRVNIGVGDSADLTAVVTQGTSPLANRNVTFATSLGGVSDTSGSLLSSTYSAVTDNSGVALAKIWANADAGIASVSATDDASQAKATQLVEFSLITQIQFVNVVCGTDMNCVVMGIKGSGFNETALVRFKVIDSNARGVPGVSVDCAIVNPPMGATVSPTATTDSTGVAACTAKSGPVIGAFTVTATVTGTTLSTNSNTIGIRGATPTNKGFTLQCSLVNIPTYVSNNPPLSLNSTCAFVLTDRYNNPVGTGTSVYFKVEAGKIPNSASATKFDPVNPSSPQEGKGTVTFDTVGAFPAVDVPPLPADSTQFPSARVAEPSYQDQGIQRNPRDGLVSVLAYVNGEEFFSDDNMNGQWDPGEQFIDQGEPLVDSNDNGVWDNGETYIDTNNNNQWDGPDGVWNGASQAKSIWVETRILYTSAPAFNPPFTRAVPTPFASSCPGGLAKGGSVDVFVGLPDINLNRVTVSAMLAATLTGAKGTATWQNGLLDGYGMGIERKLLNADYVQGLDAGAASLDCLPGTPRCAWKYLFQDWGEGGLGVVRVTGAALSDATPCANVSVRIDAIVNGNRGSVTTSGGIQ